MDLSVLPGKSFGHISNGHSHTGVTLGCLAAFATAKRLVATLVNEKIVKLIQHPINGHRYWVLQATGDHFDTKIVPEDMQNGAKVDRTFGFILHSMADFPRFCLDPDDIQYPIVSIKFDEVGSTQVLPSDILAWVVESHRVTDCFAVVTAEIISSVENQAQIYKEFDGVYPSIASNAIKWEESIIGGHATHPMHKTRLGFSLAESKLFCAEFRPLVHLRFIVVPRSFVQVNGDYDNFMAENIVRRLQHANVQLNIDEVLMLVHPKQMETLAKLLPNSSVPYRLLPESFPCRPQTSIRSVAPLDPSTLEPLPFHLKLGLNVRTTSCLRTVSKYSVYNGPHLTQPIAKMLLRCDQLKRRIFPGNEVEFEVAYEIASAGLNHSASEDVAKHLACVFRLNPDLRLPVANDLPHTNTPEDRYIIACSLVERQQSGVSYVVDAFALNTRTQRQEFLQQYADSYFHCFLPSLLCHGFAFEGHGQNTLLKIRLQPNSGWKIVGFCIRDLGGLQIHQDTFVRSFPDGSNQLDLLPNSSILVSTVDKAIENLFHCAIQNQLHRLIRALDLHYDSSGWQIVYRQLSQFLDVFQANTADDQLIQLNLQRFRSIWFGEKVGYKAFMKMKFDGLYRDYIFEPISNILLKGKPNPEDQH